MSRISFCLLLLFFSIMTRQVDAAQQPTTWHRIEFGDTWTALSIRYGVSQSELRSSYQHPNKQWQPPVGLQLEIAADLSHEKFGTISRPGIESLFTLAAETGKNAWALSLQNGNVNPYLPLLHRPIFMEGASTSVREYPYGISAASLKPAEIYPGSAVVLLGSTANDAQVCAGLGGYELRVIKQAPSFVALIGLGAFYEPGAYSLDIGCKGLPLWSQPLTVLPGEWTFQQITLTGEAAAIDQQSIIEERERLTALWNQVTPQPLWQSSFKLPIESYLDITSLYGARRSYNGGPYSSYHEGTDFSAFAGTPVLAPASGRVMLAERLTVRGGAVIIDHGLGIFSGFYHLSEVSVTPGDEVEQGQLIGKVGTTGLSTGNHLHWDLLVAGIWIDPLGWMEQDIACPILSFFGGQCDDTRLAS